MGQNFMNKALTAILAITSLGVAARAQEATRTLQLPHRDSPARLETSEMLTVPSETQVSVQMLSGIHTRLNQPQDLITARLIQPVYVNGRVALPSGSILDGHITTIQNADMAHRPARLRLRFDKIVLPDGQSQPIAAVLAKMDKSAGLDLHIDSEGYLVGGRTRSWKTLMGGVGLGGFGAIKALASGVTATSATLSLVGAGVMGYALLVPRGQEVNLPPQTRCYVRLNYPLTVKITT